MGKISRREALAGAAAGTAWLAAGAARAAAETQPAASIRLTAEGAPRTLPTRFWGYNSPAPYVPYQNPNFVTAVKALGTRMLRFPGGTVGNYYDWHIGHMVVPDAGKANSPYRKRMVEIAMPAERRTFPKGMWVEDWDRIAKSVGADLVIEANLETSTPADQAAWFADMRKKGVSAGLVELGTEFFFAMRDEMGRRRFPNPQVTAEISKSFYDAIKPQLPRGAKVAVQSSSRAFESSHPPRPGESRPPNDDITLQRIWQWDAALKPEPWFDAVTMHLYPKMYAAAGDDAVRKLPATTGLVFDAMMARADEGFDTAIRDVAARVPGKEIWLTEYGAFEPMQTFYNVDVHFNGLWLHQVTREMLSIMRHPQVTMALYHALKGDGSLMATFRTDGTALKPINASGVQSWVFHACDGPACTWQRVKIDGAKKIVAHGTRPGQTYWDVDAALFGNGARRTLLVHNASALARNVDLARLLPPGATATAETIATPDLLASLETAPPVPVPQSLTSGLTVPPYSVTRVMWSA